MIIGCMTSIAPMPMTRLTPAFQASFRSSAAAVRSRSSSSANAADQVDSPASAGTLAS